MRSFKISNIGIFSTLLLCASLAACDINRGSVKWEIVDNDGDGYSVLDGDCNEYEPDINPGMTEICGDGVDQDCDGSIDEDCDTGDTGLGPIDDDGDGWSTAEDCDDTDALVHPEAEEVCDGVDNDCDGFIDNGASDEQNWFRDQDGDGFGDPESATLACDQPENYVSNNTDCDDTDAETHPNADEICDGGIDNDCDGLIDDDDVVDNRSTLNTWYQDVDGDGFGNSDFDTEACDQPTGYSANSTDCDDADATVNPGAAEVCGDGIDNDCDGGANDTNGSTWTEDADGDSYGSADSSALTQVACTQPSGYELDNTDCNDLDATVNPGATETCDGVDTNCSGDEADAIDTSVWHQDTDGDGYGHTAITTDACTQPDGYVSDNTDCDDADAVINPGATEVCDSADVDENCNGVADDDDSSVDLSTESDWYYDGDGDSYGDSASTVSQCNQPSGYLVDNTDCDDADAAINPGATEVCDSADVDENCNGLADDSDSGVDPTTESTWYADNDGDSYGDPSNSVNSCDAYSVYIVDDTDCDDTDAAINPDTVWYADGDGDGYGDATTSLTQCVQPSGYVLDGTDCDDADALVITGEWYDDIDSDGYGDDSTISYTCSPTSGQVSEGGDCDDTNATVNPGEYEALYDLATDTVTENCSDGVDNDCNGDADSSDDACIDADGDNLEDGLQLALACDIDADGSDDGLCFVQAFADAGSSWSESDCITSNSYPWSSISLASAEADVTSGISWGGYTYSSEVCLLPHIGGYVTQRAYSGIGSDGTSTVDSSDTSDWVGVGIQAYCGNSAAGGLSDYCAYNATAGVYFLESTATSSGSSWIITP